jgi:hypothetical protein
MIVRNPSKVCKYVLKADRGLPKEEQTVFLYVPADLDAQYDLLDNNLVMEKKPDGTQVTKMSFDKSKEAPVLLKCITQIDNLKDQDGELLVWSATNEEENKKVLSTIPGECRLELLQVVRTGNELEDDEVKN